MAVTYGFYNALNHDRLYDAIQMSSIFDGIIRDGIFSTIGDTMIVTAPEDGLYVNVGSGRAWFNHTWTLNDTAYPIEAEQAEVVLDRIDAVILEVNSSAEVRANSIKFLKGTPSSNPVKPTLTHNAEVNQYALAYVRIRAGQTTIFQSDIENAVGTDETPFITGVLQQVSIETLLKQWETEFNTYFTNFQNTSTTEFDDWFQRMKDQLSQDAAGNLQLQIDDIADEKANNDILSDAWNASTTYAVGQYCIYNNSLWKCLVKHKGQTPKTGTYWTKVTVANEITSVNNSFGGLKFGVDSNGNYGYIKAGADSVTPFRSDYFFLNNLESNEYNASMNSSSITVTIPTNDCYILYGTSTSNNFGVEMRTNSQTSFSISSGVTKLFEATTGNNNLIGLVHCRGLKGKSLTINTNLSVYRMSARIYYQNQ